MQFCQGRLRCLNFRRTQSGLLRQLCAVQTRYHLPLELMYTAVPLIMVLVLFWYRWLAIGVAINVAILIALLWAHWPPASQVGS